MVTDGTRLGRYVVTAPIGAGGMGEVFRANDTLLAREVAMAKELNLDPDVVLGEAGRVASDVLATIKAKPVEMSRLIRAAREVMQ